MVVVVRRLQTNKTEEAGDGPDSGDDVADLDAAAQGQATQLAAETKASTVVMLAEHPGLSLRRHIDFSDDDDWQACPCG